MRVEDLNINELVEFDSEDGVVRFAGQRALIIDATAKGNLRKELINHFGVSTARAVLTRVGSYEAEQHIAHLGLSDTSVCWTICGLTSGYLSRALGKEIYVLEERCIGRGDAACHLLGRTLEEWGDARADELRFYRVQNLKEWLRPP